MSPSDEYQSANENVRYYGTAKLAEVTIFVGVTGGLLTALFTVEAPGGQVALKVFGLLTTCCFFVIMESTHYALFHFMKRAAALEPALGYKLWSTVRGGPKFRLRPATWASRVFYAVTVIFWCLTLLPGINFGLPMASKPAPTNTVHSP